MYIPRLSLFPPCPTYPKGQRVILILDCKSNKKSSMFVVSTLSTIVKILKIVISRNTTPFVPNLNFWLLCVFVNVSSCLVNIED